MQEIDDLSLHGNIKSGPGEVIPIEMKMGKKKEELKGARRHARNAATEDQHRVQERTRTKNLEPSHSREQTGETEISWLVRLG